MIKKKNVPEADPRRKVRAKWQFQNPIREMDSKPDEGSPEIEDGGVSSTKREKSINKGRAFWGRLREKILGRKA